MNINDVQSPTEYPEDILGAIFALQRELMEKYHPIEKSNGLLLTEDVPVDLDDRFGQARLKDFAWRFMEEIGEAIESDASGQDLDHTQEELIDALHFLVEFCILAGVEPEFLLTGYKNLDECVNNLVSIGARDFRHNVTALVMSMGQACNCLKNKPWKQTHILTDKDKFRSRVFTVFRVFIMLCISFRINSAQEIYDLYFRKSEVNKFRQRSAY